MPARETVAALVLAGALALSAPAPLYASDTHASALETPGSASAETQIRQLSLKRKADGSIRARLTSKMTGTRDSLTCRTEMNTLDGSTQTLELRIKNVSVGELGSDSEAELVSIESDGSHMRVGCTSTGSPLCHAAYTISMRLVGEGAAVPKTTLLLGKQPVSGNLRAQGGSIDSNEAMLSGPTSLGEALAAQQDGNQAKSCELTDTWSTFMWSGAGSIELSLSVSPGATMAGSDATNDGETPKPDETDREETTEDLGAADSGEDFGKRGNAEKGDGEGVNKDDEEDDLDTPSSNAIAMDGQSELARTMGVATDIDPANYTATVDVSDVHSLVAADAAVLADEEPKRQYVILTVPKTFEFLFLPSGEVVAPSALTIWGGERAYNDIKNMTITDKSTEATLELYATAADGTVTEEFDGTTYLKKYRRLKVKEDISYTAKLAGFDYKSEQDLVMAAIEEPQHLFTLGVVFVPVIPSS